jgi:hypothetical protein
LVGDWLVGVGSIGILTRGLTLAGQEHYHLSHAPGPFCLSYFLNRVSHSCEGQPGHHPPIYASCIGGITSVCHCTQLLVVLVEIGSKSFCPGWPQTDPHDGGATVSSIFS